MRTETPNVLIIVGPADLRELYTGVAEQGGYKAIGQENGTSGLAYFKENPDTQIILVEHDLPDITGDIVAQRMREISGNPNLPQILMVAGSGSMIDRQTATQRGVNELIDKWPIPSKLIRELAEADQRLQQSMVPL